MEEVRQIKKLKSQLTTMLQDADVIKIEVANKQREFETKIKSIKKLQDEIERLNNAEGLRVSEHAIIRYFERVKGFDLIEIEKEILSDSILKMIETLGGSGTYPNEGFSVVMRNNTVTTII